MRKTIDEISSYLDAVNEFSLPLYRELPNVDLYMEQVLKYINGVLASLSKEGENALTSFMVNNYVKGKLVSEPVKKKYSKDQIGYLLAISLMKQTLSMADMGLLIELDRGISADKEKLYAFWSRLEQTLLSDASKRTKSKVNAVAKRYESELEAGDESAELNARDALGFIALRLAIQAQANKLLSDYILSKLRESETNLTKKPTKGKKNK